MQVLHPFPIPEEPPVVPQRLADRVLSLWSALKKVDVMIARAGGWQVVNAVTIEPDDDPADVYGMVKMCADHHASTTGESAKYRAQLWSVEVGRDGVRNYCTFAVQCPYDDDDPNRSAADEELQALRSQWAELFQSQQDFAKLVMRFSEFSIERVVAMSKQHGEQLNPLTEVIHELITPYRDGLQMQARAVKEMGDMRVRQHLAEARADDSGKFWDMFGPAVQIAATQASQRFMGGGSKPARPAPGRKPRGTKVVTHTPPHAAPSRTVVPPTRVQPTAATAPPPEPAAAAPQPEPGPDESGAVPNTLHELARALLDGMSSDTLVKVTRVLEEDQADCFVGIAEAGDDDTAAESIVSLMHSLMKTPAALVQMQQLLGSDHIRAFQQVAVLAKRHLDERDAASPAEPIAAGAGDAAARAEATTDARRVAAPPRAKSGPPSRFAAPPSPVTSTGPMPDDAEAVPRSGTDAAETDPSSGDPPS